MIPQLIYLLCTGTCFGCAFLLFRAFRESRSRFLFWSFLHFLILGLANLVMFLDLSVIPDVDLLGVRNGITLGAILVLICGLIFEAS